jgi:hypothetical protein
MQLPDDVYTKLVAFAARYPIPQGTPGEAHEEACRQWTLRFCEQCTFSFPFMRYGAKRASPDRPTSKDTLARQDVVTLWGWDLLIGAGTGRPTLISGPGPGKNLTDPPDGPQVFVEVAPYDWLGDPDVAPAPTCPCAEQARTMLAALATLAEQQQAILRVLADLPTRADLAGFPTRADLWQIVADLRANPLPVKFRW